MERNIFETAANKLRKAPKPATPESARMTSALPQKITTEEFGAHDPEINQMLEKIRQMRVHLQTQLTNMYDKGSQYRFDVERFLKNETNFSPKDMAKMLAQGQQLEDQVNSVMTPGSGVVPRAKSKETMEKERKAKTLGSRKKNWISVR